MSSVRDGGRRVSTLSWDIPVLLQGKKVSFSLSTATRQEVTDKSWKARILDSKKAMVISIVYFVAHKFCATISYCW